MGRERWYLKSIMEFHPGIIIPPSILKGYNGDSTDRKRTDSEDINNSYTEVGV